MRARDPGPSRETTWARGHLTSQLLGPAVICAHRLVIPHPKFFLGISGRLRPQNVTIWDDPGNGEPVEICPGKVHIGVLEDVTEEHEQYDVDPAHFGLKLSSSRPLRGRKTV